MASSGNTIGCGNSGEMGFFGEKLIYPAATRNKDPILKVLQKFIPRRAEKNEDTLFLEISSGSGQHVAHFAPQFPHIRFQPSEVDSALLGSITFYAKNCETQNISPPLLLDICKKLCDYGFKPESVDYIYNANMIHISPYECTVGLFENAGVYLKLKGLMFTYGPYSKDGIITPESNALFHKSLLSRDPSWGLRDINDLVKLAKANNLKLLEEVDMPANNKTLIWGKVK